MKRWRDDGGFDDERERKRREEIAQTPLVVQSVAPRERGRRLLLPLAVGAVALLFVLAMAGRYVSFFSAASQTPAPPTPIPWLDATAGPVAPAPTPDPSASPGASPTLAPKVDAEIIYQSYLVAPGETIHFVVKLTNTSGGPIAFDPCPTYRLYVAGSNASEPDRPLNCAAAPATFLQGESISFAMVYVIPADVGPGQQLLVWEATRHLRATRSTTLSVGGEAGTTPS